MVNYQNSKIYRLDCGDLVYIGATTYKLSLRKAIHKGDYVADRSYCRSKLLYKYAEDNGLDLVKDIKIELIENCPCNNKEELSAIEGKYIRQYKEEYGDNCVNRIIAGRTTKEYYADNRDKVLQRHKEWYKTNKDKRTQQKKEYREQNKVQIAEQHKEYYERNKDKIKAYYQQYCLFKKIDKIFGLSSQLK
jgi:hypothetical protein